MHIVWDAFQKLLPYLGSRWTTVIATVLLIIMVRIIFAFVLKIFRFNLDYHAPQKNAWSHKENKSDIDKVVEKFHQKVGD